ncbi:small, acid-soluble spore protein L [Fictibacillus aquaticus]|uniref:Small, acid-soluble spore protein L n=1 Tax=Fictibacillus aquaticus TaxID=2021314 RepID=A0A235FDA2_9BACL|nr:small, acid-soluble spore protein L [Fictibacillus aquaticus]OYD59209.1 small, acid-soluble spore protein L [Fictibacillus aquaticus]
MAKKSAGKGQRSSSVNPQGMSPDAEIAKEPHTELENRAKKKNTKI